MFQQKRRILIIFGAMKAGTSALFHGLADHPHILGSRDKEPKYWVRDDARAKGMGPYLSWWDPATKPDAKWWMEASTDYGKVPVERSPATKLRHIDADLRFIFVTRNPVERIRSHYEMALAHGWIAHPISVKLDPTATWFSNYYRQVQPFVDCFGRDAVHVLSHEELVSDSAGAIRDICRFLDLDPLIAPLELPRVNEAAEHRGLRRRAALQRAEAEGRAITEAQLQVELKADITPGPEVIAHLHRELDHDLGLFTDLFGLDPWTGARRAPKPLSTPPCEVPAQLLDAIPLIRAGDSLDRAKARPLTCP